MSQLTQFQEIKRYIRDSQPHVRCEAVRILASCSGNAQMQPFFSSLGFGEDLVYLLSDTNEQTCRYACITLINLTANPNFLAKFVKESPFNSIIKKLTLDSTIESAGKKPSISSKSGPDSNKSDETAAAIDAMSLTELMLQILVNSTRDETGRTEFLLLNKPTRRGLYLLRLVYLLKNVDLRNKYCLKSYAYLPYILCNLTQSFDGRHLLIEPKRNLLKYVMPLLNYNDSVVDDLGGMDLSSEYYEYYQLFMHGLWDTMKNICFSLEDSPDTLLSALKLGTRSKQNNNNNDNDKNSSESDAKCKDKEVCKDESDESDESDEDQIVSAQDQEVILKYFMNVFCNCDSVESVESSESIESIESTAVRLDDNNLVFEIVAPILGAMHEYDSGSLRLRKKVESENKKKAKGKDGKESKLNRFDRILEGLMKCDKNRSDDVKVRQTCLQCIHLIVGVTDRYGLHKQLPQFLDKYVYLEAILENYQMWEHDEALVDLVKQILKTLKWQRDKLKNGDKQENEAKEANETNEGEAKTQEEADGVVTETEETKNEKGNEDETESSGMDVAPMQQNFGVYPKKDERSFNQAESSLLFDLFEQGQKALDKDKDKDKETTNTSES